MEMFWTCHCTFLIWFPLRCVRCVWQQPLYRYAQTHTHAHTHTHTHTHRRARFNFLLNFNIANYTICARIRALVNGNHIAIHCWELHEKFAHIYGFVFFNCAFARFIFLLNFNRICMFQFNKIFKKHNLARWCFFLYVFFQ